MLVNPGGSRLWRFRYRVAGRENLISFGSYPEVPLKLARQRREEARRLGLSGWVMNLPGGDVEVAAGGEPSSLERLRRALEVGPTGAGVSEVTDIPGDLPTALPYPFTIHR